MPPARKDPPGVDDVSRPSTSRSFSPSLAIVPPVKRARTSTGGVSSTTRRLSGGRQARMDEFIDEKELQDRLLHAVTETADEIMKEDEEAGKERIEIEKEVISAAAGIVWDALSEDWATDLIAFSRHAGRETIRDDDVKLLMRRNPALLAEILGNVEGETSETKGSTKKRKSTGGLPGRPRKAPKEEEKKEVQAIDDVTTPRGTTTTSVVPETPQDAVPKATSTPVVGRIAKLRKGSGTSSFSIPSPIIEEEEENGGRKKVNRSIMGDLSTTLREGEDEKKGADTQPIDGHTSPLVIDLRHPREQEEEERRMSRIEDDDRSEYPSAIQQPGPSTIRHDYGRVVSPELFEHSVGEDNKQKDYDSFDEEIVFVNKENARGGDESTRMSESAALREMLDEEEEEKERTEMRREREDSFDDDESIQFVEVRKEEKTASPRPIGDFPSAFAVSATVQQGVAAAAPPCPPIPAAAAVSATSQRSSQDSFYRDEILDDPPQAKTLPPPAAASTVLQVSPAAAAQAVRADNYDSFDDDDDDFVSVSSRSKENTPKTIGGPSPSTTVVNRGSTVDIEGVQKKTGNKRMAIEDVFGLNEPSASSKSTPVNRPSPCEQSSANKNKDGKTSIPSPFNFFSEDSPSGTTPAVKREDSDFVDTSMRQTPSTTMTPRGRGGGGRGFTPRGRGGYPRKVDPNSKLNRKIREQNTAVRLPHRPPSRINEVVESFEDDFDASGFDD